MTDWVSLFTEGKKRGLYKVPHGIIIFSIEEDAEINVDYEYREYKRDLLDICFQLNDGESFDIHPIKLKYKRDEVLESLLKNK